MSKFETAPKEKGNERKRTDNGFQHMLKDGY